MTCVGRLDDGNPCRVPALAGSGFCWNHEPGAEMDERRNEARRAGGRARGLQLSRATANEGLEAEPPSWWGLTRPDDARAAFGWCVVKLAVGRLDSRTGNALVAALNGLVATLKDAEQEQRMRTLERVLNINR